MPDRPARLYALRSTCRAVGESGSSLPLSAPFMAMRWYFTHERHDQHDALHRAGPGPS
ncbi:hypothetical protein ACIO6T_30745 [Streptomyces sp. NPDC087532]|uniref:hypothetical protein n=1 Tax=Streptomyces sp. NPDC087532 TaxID=3365795 RepID=UPI003810EA2B